MNLRVFMYGWFPGLAAIDFTKFSTAVTVVATGLDIFQDNLIRGLPRDTYIVYEKRNTIYMSLYSR